MKLLLLLIVFILFSTCIFAWWMHYCMTHVRKGDNEYRLNKTRGSVRGCLGMLENRTVLNIKRNRLHSKSFKF